MRAHDQQRTFKVLITAATTARSIRLIVETIIASHTGAYHITLKARRRTTVCLLIGVEFTCVEHCP